MPRVKGRATKSATVRAEPSPLAQDKNALWNDYFSCYNRTPLGDAVQAIVDTLAQKRQAGVGKVTLIGGIEALLARAVAPDLCPGPTVIDLAGFAADEDVAYLERAYAPCLRAVGGLHTAALLVSSKPLLLHNTQRRFRAENIVCRLEPEKLSEDEIQRWLG